MRITTASHLATTRRLISMTTLCYAMDAHVAPGHLTRSFTLQKEGPGFGITLTVIAVLLTVAAVWYGLTR